MYRHNTKRGMPAKKALRVGDPTSKCPQCGQTGKVVTGENKINNYGKAQAIDGSIVQCGCPYGTNFVIAATPNISSRTTFENKPNIPSPKIQQLNQQSDQSTLFNNKNNYRYTVTIYIAYPNTPLNKDNGTPNIGHDGKRARSTAGHMWYQINKIDVDKISNIITVESKSFGFSPKEPSPFGNGEISDKDTVHYENPHYRRVIEISQTQYQQLLNYGTLAKAGSNPDFLMKYIASANSCIDFTWKSLRSASLVPEPIKCKAIELPRDHCDSRSELEHKQKGEFDGRILVGNNIIQIRAIKAPYPHSELNTEIINTASSTSVLTGSDPTDIPSSGKIKGEL